MESDTKLPAGGSEETGPSTRKCVPRTQNKLKLPVHETRGVSVMPVPASDRPSSAPGRHKSRKTDDPKISHMKRTPSAPQSTNRTSLDSHKVILKGGRHSSVAPVSPGNVTESQRTLIDANMSYSRVPSTIDWDREPEPEQWQRHVETPNPEEEEIVIVDPLSPRKKTIGKRIRDLTKKFFLRNSVSKKISIVAPPPEPPEPSPSSANVRCHALDGGTTVDTMINFIPPRRHHRHPNKMDREPQLDLTAKPWFRAPREEVESIHAFPDKPHRPPNAMRFMSTCSLGSEMSFITLKEPGLSTAFPSLVSVVSQQGPKLKKKNTGRLTHSITPDGKIRLLVLSKKTRPASLVRLPSTKKPKGKCKQRPTQKAVPRAEVPVPDTLPAVPPPKCTHKPKKCAHKSKADPAASEQKPDQSPVPVLEPQPGPSSAAGSSNCKTKKPVGAPKAKDYSYLIPDPIPPFVPPSERSVERTSKHKKE